MAGGAGSARSTSAPTTAATSSQARSETASASACSAGVDGDGGEQPLAVGGERDRDGVARACPSASGRARPRRGAARRRAARAAGPWPAAAPRRRRRRRARRRGLTRDSGGVERRPGRLAVDGEDDALEPRAAVEVAPHLLDLDARGVLEREAPDAGAERDEREAPARRARPRAASVEAVARRMMSSEVGPPSSIVAAWMTQRDGMSPAVVSTASPRPIGAFASDSRWTSGPPAREIAPATPPPWARSVFAALAMASTSSAVMSVSSTSIVAMTGYGTRMATIRRRVVAHGRVQGVFFRDSTREEAERRGVDRLGAQHAERARSRPSSRASPTRSRR